MKILFVSPVGAMFSGAEVSIVNLMKLLVQKGHEVYNVIPDNTPHIDKDYLRHMDTTGIKLFQLKTISGGGLSLSVGYFGFRNSSFSTKEY